LVISLLLVATRDLPWILVVPALAGAALVGVLLLTFVFPAIGRQIFTANGYFVQSRLYSTIAEAQRTDLGVFVFSVGFMTFFLALVGLGFVVAAVVRRWERPHVFILGWGLVSIYMAFAASRFVYNATPVFAILAGWTVARLVKWMDLRTARRNFESLKRDSVTRATRSTLSSKVVVGVLFLVLTLIIPNLWFSVDAGIPGEFRAQARENHPGQRDLITNRTGAFGQGFLGQNWIRVYDWLSDQDAVGFDGQAQSCAERPAHSAWWDYGFWEVALGCHPTVSDNFQNGYQLTGRHLAAQGEKEGLEWWVIRVLEGDKKSNDPRGSFTPQVAQALDETQAGLADQMLPLLTPSRYDEAWEVFRNTTDNLEDLVDLYERIQEASGFRISYFLVDDRMMPFDDPNTPDIEAGSIFYAPVFLANKNPDDFVQTVYRAGGGTYRVNAYETQDDGDVVQVRPSQITAGGREFIVSGNQLFRLTPDGERIDYAFGGGQQGQGLSIEAVQLQYKDPFYETMFYKAFAGTRPQFGNLPSTAAGYQPGEGLAHMRLVRQAGDPFGVKLLKYYPGAIVTGTLADDGGAPMGGIEVVAVDDMGIRHHSVEADADGSFRVIAPFGLPDRNGTLQPTRIQAVDGGAVLAEAEVLISEAAAYRKETFEFTADLTVTTGNLTGFAFLDQDRDGEYNETVDQVADGAAVSLEGGPSVSVGADGRFEFTKIQPGSKRVNISGVAGYDALSQTVAVSSGETTDRDFGLTAARIVVNGTIGPDAPPNYQVNVTAVQPDVDRGEDASATADATGNFTVRLFPGQYTARVETDNDTYEATFTLELGQGSFDLRPQDWTVTARES
jgi:dolichyl-diphosphooligosaccharide--protein glycosyltransferase